MIAYTHRCGHLSRTSENERDRYVLQEERERDREEERMRVRNRSTWREQKIGSQYVTLADLELTM